RHGSGAHGGDEQTELLKLESLQHGQAAQGQGHHGGLDRRSDRPTQQAKPERNAGRRYADQNPEECPLDDFKINTDRRREIENDIYRISKSLLVDGVSGTRSIERAAVVSGLNFSCDLGAIRISAMQEEFPRSQPTGIEIGKISARPVMRSGVRNLVRNQHTVRIGPRAHSTKDRKQRQLPGTKPKPGRSRDGVHPVTSGSDALRSAPVPAWFSLRAKATPRANNGSVIRHSDLSCIRRNQYRGVRSSSSNPAASR